MNIYTFIITSLIIIIIPGTGVIYTISTGLTKGKRASIVAALGCTAGIIPHLIVSICLSSLMININEHAFFILKLAGTLYLLYLGISMILSKTKLNFGETTDNDKSAIVMRRAILINLLNPKLTLFFFAFLPQYISSGSKSYVSESVFIGIGFMILTFLIFCIYGILAGFMKTFITKAPKRIKYIQQTFGVIFIGFAVNLVMSSL